MAAVGRAVMQMIEELGLDPAASATVISGEMTTERGC